MKFVLYRPINLLNCNPKSRGGLDSLVSILGTQSTFKFSCFISFKFSLCKIKCQISGLPVTIRLLDPPLHEFLPEGDLQQIVGELTAETGINEDEVFSRIEKLSEVNPMLGFRGCRFSGLLTSFYSINYYSKKIVSRKQLM